MAELFKLYRIQQLDSQIDQAKYRIDEIRRILSDETERENAAEALASLSSKLAELRKHQKNIETQVNTQKAKIQQNQAALYGGKIKNPKELRDLEIEASALQRYLTTLEDELIEAMIAVEQAETAQQAAKEHYEDVHSAFDNLRNELETESRLLEQQIERLLTEKKTIAQTIPSDELTYYEEIRAKRNGIAVSKITDSFCSVCGSRLNSSLIHTAKITQGIARCETCGRILFAG